MKPVSKTDVLVIGAGPAGMMASIQLAQRGFSVVLAEKQARPGIKLLMTGNGRCNISNALPMNYWDEKIPRNPGFLKAAFNAFTNDDLCRWMMTNQIKLISDQHGRLFPESDSAKTILSMLESNMFESGVKFIQQRITSLQINRDSIEGAAHDDGFMLSCPCIVVACGGKSYPQTGSNGEGYALAKQAGHQIVDPRPSLSPLSLAGAPFREFSGASLAKVRLQLMGEDNHKITQMQGPLLFTHRGVSGPIVLDISAYLANQDLKLPRLVMDWLPDYSDEEIMVQWGKHPRGKSMKHWLVEQKILPQRFCHWLLNDFSTWQEVHPALWMKKERARFLEALKRYSCDIDPMPSFDEGMVTSGGVSVQEISSKTMQSKKCKGLYFAGEVLDVDALSGGFNIQIALSTGYLAGISVRFPGA